ncbi:MAG TPA: hypothetical protein VMB21_06320 [Candidatus Limnocylindria bacterium]|nr:hypothetical protein [Candidatus Limnocylindria bacterium]
MNWLLALTEILLRQTKGPASPRVPLQPGELPVPPAFQLRPDRRDRVHQTRDEWRAERTEPHPVVLGKWYH